VCMRGASSAVLVAADREYPSSGFTIECPVVVFRRRPRRHQRMSTPPANSSVTPPRTLPTIAPMGGVELRAREEGIAEPAASPEPEDGIAELPVISELSLSLLRDTQRMLRRNANQHSRIDRMIK
jgi:hypothetical protein